MSRKQSIGAIVLAAGRSTRMGGIKQLLPYKGRPLVQHVLDLVGCMGFAQRVLVLGYAASEIRGHCVVDGLSLIYNPDFEQGQSTSVRAGIQALDPGVQGALFFLGDQPLIAGHTVQAVIQAWEHTQAPIVVPVYNQQRGHPVFFHRSLFSEILSESGDTGPRALLSRYAHCLQQVDVHDPGIVHDVDIWEDYCRLP